MRHAIMVAALFGSLVGLGWAPAASDNWPEFRGPAGDGHSDATGLPREWSETKNVVWKTPIQGRGWSSPVVWGKQVWLTTATPEGKEFFVICVDRDSGKVIVNHKLFDCAKPEDTKKYNSFASPTCAIEEGHVYVHFGSYGTACLDTKAGKILWERQDLKCNHWRGPGSSPVIFQNLLILTFDGYDFQYVCALDKKTGRTVWKTDRTHDFGTNDGDQKKGYSTPQIIEVGGKPQLVSPASGGTEVLDPMTGKLLWYAQYKGHSPAARSMFGHGLVYVTNGAGRELIALKTDGKGDVSSSHIAWKTSNKGVGHKPSPILVDDLIYSVSDGGVASCMDAKTGAVVWADKRVGSGFSAGPLFADGAIYFFAEDGSALAIEHGKEYKEIGKGKLDGGTECKSTPAISGKAFFIRTDTHLYRIEAK